MIFLILAILSSAAISLVMRLSEGRVNSKMGLFLFNYLTCIVLSLIFTAGSIGGSTSIVKEGLSTVLILGIISGFLYLASFMILQHNYRVNGMILSSTFMKLGVVIPTIIAMLFFRENPGPLQVCGMVLTLLAIIIMNYEREEGKTSGRGLKAGIWLIIMLLSSGFTDAMANFYDELGTPALKDHYLLVTFFAAFMCSIILAIYRKERISREDVLFGLILGIPNYFCSRFLLLSLSRLKAIIVYPVYSVGTILTISLIGILFFKDRLKKKEILAMAIVVMALILLNV